MFIILLHQFDEHHNVIDILEDESFARIVLLFSFQVTEGLIAPMSKRIEMMGRMPTVVEAVSVALQDKKLAMNLNSAVNSKDDLLPPHQSEQWMICNPNRDQFHQPMHADPSSLPSIQFAFA